MISPSLNTQPELSSILYQRYFIYHMALKEPLRPPSSSSIIAELLLQAIIETLQVDMGSNLPMIHVYSFVFSFPYKIRELF